MNRCSESNHFLFVIVLTIWMENVSASTTISSFGTCLLGLYPYPQCNTKCGNCNEGDINCNRQTGICTNGCVEGWYGSHCNMTCGNCLNKKCDQKTSVCDPCQPHIAMQFCRVCSDGSYGLNCIEVCGHCLHGETCNDTTGHCSQCAANFISPLCQECETGFYLTGQTCTECGHCNGSQPCNNITGHCSAGCRPGWKGDQCNEKCDNGTFGKDCSEKCDNCVNGMCDNQNDLVSAPPPPSSSFFVVYIVIAVVCLVVVLIILIVVYRKCASSDMNQRCSAPHDDHTYMDINSSVSSYVSISPNLPKFSREVFADHHNTSVTVRHLGSERPETAHFSSINQNDDVQNDKSPNPCSHYLKGYEIPLPESRSEAENDDQLGHNRQIMNDPDGYLQQYTLVRRIGESNYLHPTVSLNGPNSNDF